MKKLVLSILAASMVCSTMHAANNQKLFNELMAASNIKKAVSELELNAEEWSKLQDFIWKRVEDTGTAMREIRETDKKEVKNLSNKFTKIINIWTVVAEKVRTASPE